MELRRYKVRMTFKTPAWDEREGITYETTAATKSDACKRARRQSEDDGHTGIRYYKATQSDDLSEA